MIFFSYYYLLLLSQKSCCTGAFCIILCSFFGDFIAKIEKNLPIFCNFFLLCINDLREI